MTICFIITLVTLGTRNGIKMHRGYNDQISTYPKQPNPNALIDKTLFNSTISDLKIRPRIELDTNSIIYNSPEVRKTMFLKYGLKKYDENGELVTNKDLENLDQYLKFTIFSRFNSSEPRKEYEFKIVDVIDN